jgi:hypothetical protein
MSDGFVCRAVERLPKLSRKRKMKIMEVATVTGMAASSPVVPGLMLIPMVG